MITAETRIGVRIHPAVPLDFERRRIVLIEIFAVSVFHRFRVARTVCSRASNANSKRYRDEYRGRKVTSFHGVSSVTSHRVMACGFYNRTRGAAKDDAPG